jgi:hypothetical protein
MVVPIRLANCRSGVQRVQQRQRGQFAVQAPQQQRRLDAFGQQAIERAQRGLGVTLQGAFGQQVQFIAGAVADLVENVIDGHCGPARVQQAQLADLLNRRQQVALDPLRQQFERIGGDFESGPAEALAQELRHLPRFDRPDLHHHALLVDGLMPAAPGRLGVEAWRGDQQGVIAGGGSQTLLQHGGASLWQLVGQAQLQQPAAGEQRQALRADQQPRPVEARFGEMDLALVAAAPARGLANLVGGFEQQQRFIAADQIDRLHLALQMAGKLLEAQLHGRQLAGSVAQSFASCAAMRVASSWLIEATASSSCCR